MLNPPENRRRSHHPHHRQLPSSSTPGTRAALWTPHLLELLVDDSELDYLPHSRKLLKWKLSVSFFFLCSFIKTADICIYSLHYICVLYKTVLIVSHPCYSQIQKNSLVLVGRAHCQIWDWKENSFLEIVTKDLKEYRRMASNVHICLFREPEESISNWCTDAGGYIIYSEI